MRVVFHRDGGDLFPGGAVVEHVAPRAHSVVGGHDQPVDCVEVGGIGHDPACDAVGHLLRADDQHDVIQACCDRDPGFTDRGGAAGTVVFVIGYRQTTQTHLGGDALAGHRAAEHVSDVDGFDVRGAHTGVGHCLPGRPDREFLEGHCGGIFAEPHHTGAGDVGLGHRFSSPARNRYHHSGFPEVSDFIGNSSTATSVSIWTSPTAAPSLRPRGGRPGRGKAP